MNHSSMPMNCPIEIIHMEPTDVSPLISKCTVKVCYVEDKPNRNKSVITKDVARNMAPSLRGAAIVGHYVESKGDFEQHNRLISVGEELKMVEDTRPYGFVDLNAPVWFQKFLDDGMIEREYLVTEGYLWTGQYPECKRVIERGNAQSMELDDKNTHGYWTKFNNENMKFFIINDAVISKLCILGENVEPCFEGASITNTQYNLNPDEFKVQLYTLMQEIKEVLSKGGESKMYTEYSVQIGDSLFSQIYDYLLANHPNHSVTGVYQEGEQLFFVASEQDKRERFNFSASDAGIMVESPVDFTDEINPQFDAEAVAQYAASLSKNEDNNDESNASETEEVVEESTSTEVENNFNLETIPEYQEALSRISTLENELNERNTAYSALEDKYNTLETEVSSLREFKNKSERADKEKMIDSFYMLSDEDKADVVQNIDSYSLDEIESRLSVICVRNKVSFAKEEEEQPGTTTFTVEDVPDSTPSWIKAVLDTAKELH